MEPVIIDEIGIALGSGPDGYRATFRNIEAFGVSNLTLTNIRYAIDVDRAILVPFFLRKTKLYKNICVLLCPLKI